MGMERRGCIDRLYWMVNQEWEEPLNKARPFSISKRAVWEAFKRVKANQGAAGVDGESIAEFERDLTNNLYKLWNRMSSGQLFSASGEDGRDTEKRWRETGVGDPHGNRPCGSDGGKDIPGTPGGASLSSGLLRVPAWQVGDSGSGNSPSRDAGALTG